MTIAPAFRGKHKNFSAPEIIEHIFSNNIKPFIKNIIPRSKLYKPFKRNLVERSAEIRVATNFGRKSRSAKLPFSRENSMNISI
jgi:hypothetical protein